MEVGLKKTIGLIFLSIGALAAIIAYIQTNSYAYKLNSALGQLTGIGGIPVQIIVIIAGIVAVIIGIILMAGSRKK